MGIGEIILYSTEDGVAIIRLHAEEAQSGQSRLAKRSESKPRNKI